MDDCICTENWIHDKDDGIEPNEISETAKGWHRLLPMRYDDMLHARLYWPASIGCTRSNLSFGHQVHTLWLLQEIWTQAVSWYAHTCWVLPEAGGMHE